MVGMDNPPTSDFSRRQDSLLFDCTVAIEKMEDMEVY